MGGGRAAPQLGVAISPKRRVRAAHGRAREAKTHLFFIVILSPPPFFQSGIFFPHPLTLTLMSLASPRDYSGLGKNFVWPRFLRAKLNYPRARGSLMYCAQHVTQAPPLPPPGRSHCLQYSTCVHKFSWVGGGGGV